jgi:hypothetical protein
MENPDKRGGKGMLPVCCLPLWGREGVTLPAAAENKQITKKKRISTKPFFPIYHTGMHEKNVFLVQGDIFS